MDKFKLVIIGGHHTPALAVIEEIKARKLPIEIYWVGHKYSMSDSDSVSVEYTEITNLGIEFYPLKSGKVYSNLSPRSIIGVFSGFLRAYRYVSKVKPDLVLSFGGYLAVPVVIAAKLWGVASLTHEQTRVAGWANKAVAYFADVIMLSWDSSAEFYKRFKNKVVVTGLPVRKDLFSTAGLKNINPALPTIYVTGGKQGARVINLAVEKVLETLLSKYNVVHQTGGHSEYKDLDRLSVWKQKPTNGKYIISEYFFSKEVSKVFNTASLVVSRAGANTVYELCLLKKSAVLIPIPWASHNEQYINAKYMEEKGAAIIIEQEKFTGETLLQVITEFFDNQEKYYKNAETLSEGVTYDARAKITDKIWEHIQKSRQ